MKKLFVLICSAFVLPSTIWAQDIFRMEQFASEDLNGTARYVGLGGAMGALGADLTVMSTNPAGIGLYRRSDVAGTFSIFSQNDAEKFAGKGKSHLSFDNLGFVYAVNWDDKTCKFINFGFNYHKRKNFNALISADMNHGTSMASQTWQMADLADYWSTPNQATPLSYMGYETYLIGENNSGGYDAYYASDSYYRKAQWGSIQSYDFNISTNLSDQYYLGLTIGALNVNYSSYSLYGENLLLGAGSPIGDYSLVNDRDITGNGFNVKFGFIARPLRESPFRVGVAVSTPTYFNLRHKVYSDIIANYSDDGSSYDQYTQTDYDFNIHTPWKFNLSLGTTIDNWVAIGAEYEYADYSKNKVTYDDGFYDDWGSETEDKALSAEASSHMKGQSTFKLGLEMMVDPKVSVRLGYNHVTSPFKNRAFPNQQINSASLDYTTSTNYLTLSAINRLTAGVGFNFGNFYADAACLYQHQKAEFHPFNTQYGNLNNANEAPTANIKLNRIQLMLTLGYRF